MFTPEDIEARVKQRPFVPLRIVMSSGEAFEVAHPELILIGRRLLAIGTPSKQNPKYAENLHQVSILHITAIEHAPSSVPPATNGPT